MSTAARPTGTARSTWGPRARTGTARPPAEPSWRWTRGPALRWRTYTVPPGHDGGAVWSTPAIDTATGRLFVGTGNAYHAPAADTTDSILALDANSGAILAHHQATSGDVFPTNPTGVDADFGASPNLIAAPAGGLLVGEGAKDGTYRTVRPAQMKLVWKSQVGPGSDAGGVVGSTAYDGKRIFGSNALTGEVWALGRDGSPQWTSADGGTLDFNPVTTANGVLYSANDTGFLTAHNAANGAVLNRFPLGGPTFGGVSVVGGAVYVAVGVGPPPPPAPQQDGAGSIVAFGDTSQSGPGQGPQIRLAVKPRSVSAGATAVFHFEARTGSGPVAGAVVAFAGHEAVTDKSGHARIVARLSHGRHRARATKAGFRRGSVVVVAHRGQGEE